MLGSACATIMIDENGTVTKIGYTGDIGRDSNYLLRPPAPFEQCDYLITESTYGDRLHKDKEGAEEELLHVIEDTCVRKKGKLIIPSFAIGRTQEIVYILNNFYNAGKLPRIPVYVDSPLAINATAIFKMHLDDFNKGVAEVLRYDDDPFGFNTLHYITDVAKSKALNESKEPCIIISASGMMEAGRVKHHLANSVDNPKNTVLAVGYCAPTTLGARIVAGEKDISIFGMPHHVNADVYSIDAFSGHGDYKEMAEYLKCQNPDKVKKVFIVHGEAKVQETYAKFLAKNNGYKDIMIPEPGETVKL
jgi:metallo-beta-lactamase family protein